MRVERHKLWKDSEGVYYTSYLIDNNSEIEIDRLRPAVIICGSGGYIRVSERESEATAFYFLNHGYQVFVLEYSTKTTGTGCYPYPLYDLAKMILEIRLHADEWNVNRHKIGLVGFSAGGHLCACLATQWHKPFLSEKLAADSVMLRPDAVVLAYPILDYLYQIEMIQGGLHRNQYSPSKGMRRSEYFQVVLDAGVGIMATKEKLQEASPYYHIDQNTVPTFLWHTVDDELIHVGQTLRYMQKLREYMIPSELHIFESGPHGLALGDERTAGNEILINHDVTGWIDMAVRFMERQFQHTDGKGVEKTDE